MGKKWIYVVAVWTPISAIGFRHTEVEAETKDDAYQIGFETVRLNPGETRVNDYVIAFPSVESMAEVWVVVEHVEDLDVEDSTLPKAYVSAALARKAANTMHLNYESDYQEWEEKTGELVWVMMDDTWRSTNNAYMQFIVHALPLVTVL